MSTPDPPGLADDWACEAYGPEGRAVEALCFFAEPGSRTCPSLSACHEAMTAERRRVWQRIQDGAARGEPDMVYLAGEFTGAEQILGGGVIPDDDDN